MRNLVKRAILSGFFTTLLSPKVLSRQAPTSPTHMRSFIRFGALVNRRPLILPSLTCMPHLSWRQFVDADGVMMLLFLTYSGRAVNFQVA